jgi:hypothetical protein
VIAAGTKPLHDLTAGLKKRAEKKEPTTAAVATPAGGRQPGA